MTATELVDIELTDDEHDLLGHGLNEYGGPIRNQAVMARALGLPDEKSLDGSIHRLATALGRKEPMSRLDWARVVFLRGLATWLAPAWISDPTFTTTKRLR
ncbi:hypothetical protein AWC05_13705 [Mycobacterium florentinum]|uniref:Uncharacterized protein n=1 Tax=Mycobacterium florentinum TaxID=292462 RepID=A0A1X1UDP9_MYCFL|nr:hypothetical protein AWC05_13705 [Mycobacterium florentinum]BBX81463.1 hypothetical protein MFLOJ_52500 [Mycobacterium florentinum]